MADSKICARPDCAKVFHKQSGQKYWNRRNYCSPECQMIENGKRQNAKRSERRQQRQSIKAHQQNVCHETHLGRYEVKHPVILDYLRGAVCRNELLS